MGASIVGKGNRYSPRRTHCVPSPSNVISTGNVISPSSVSTERARGTR